MNHYPLIRMSAGLGLAALVAGCGTLGIGGGNDDSALAPGNENLVQEVMDLEATLATERRRADAAEKAARRAEEEAAWMAEAAEGVPAMQARISGLDGRVGQLEMANAALQAENDRLRAENADLARRLEDTRPMAAPSANEDMMAPAENGVSLVDMAGEPMANEQMSNDPRAMAATPTVEAASIADETGVYGLHLASYRSNDELARGWEQYRAAYADILGDLTVRSVLFDVPSLGGVYYRLVAGPVTGRGRAQGLCDELETRGQYCVVSEFTDDGNSQ